MNILFHSYDDELLGLSVAKSRQKFPRQRNPWDDLRFSTWMLPLQLSNLHFKGT